MKPLCFSLFFLIAVTAFAKPLSRELNTIPPPEELQRVTLQLGNSSLNLEVADDEVSRARGLMFRKLLKPNEGMLFVFPRAQQVSFWMKNTPLVLSIAYIAPGGRIIEIHDLDAMSERSIMSSSHNIAYALEVTRGWFGEHGVLPGDVISGLPSLTTAY